MQKPNSLEELPRECLITVLQAVGIIDWGNLSLTSKYFNKLIKDDSLWKSLAVAKWGPAVETLAAQRVPNGGWLAYCSHRMNLTAAPKSPLDLGQEQFQDPWEHLVCCILCSRTTGGPLIRATINNFISCWPSPTAVLAPTEDVLIEAINPLGLQINRIRALRSMSNDFLAKDWLSPSEFSGCGKFTADSWRIFCRGHRSLEDVEDKNLRKYLYWVLNSSGNRGSEGPNKGDKRTGRTKDGKVTKKKGDASKTRGRAEQQKKGMGSSTVRRYTARGIKKDFRRRTRSSKE
ncbi:hypothetical protein Ndes2526A_g06494 [Nannochloris sp. 'desiccata']|nr:hypothetical protein KSW81_008298 [Chlorella desiccata (nom. nud.)]